MNDVELSALYPLLHGKPQDRGNLESALIASIADKARESREVSERFFAVEGPLLLAAARSLAETYRKHHGSLRRPHPRDLPLRPRRHAAEGDRTDPRAGLPGLRAADGADRRLRRDRRAAERDLHDLRRRDAGARLEEEPAAGQGEGADVRMVYSPMDALALARKHPDREVVFFGLGFETTMPSTALTILQPKPRASANFSVFCNHITIVPTFKAILDSDLQLDGFIGPGHVSMVIGTAPYEFIAETTSKPMVVAGFEPLDMLQSIWMVLKQIKEGRAEIENQYARVVPDGGNAPALQAVARSTSCASSSNGAGSARSIIPVSSCATSTSISTPSGSSRFRT
jgi:hypothetical protein